MAKIRPIKKQKRDNLADEILSSRYVSSHALESHDAKEQHQQGNNNKNASNGKKSSTYQKQNEQHSIELKKILQVMKDDADMQQDSNLEIELDDVHEDMQEYDDQPVPELSQQELDTIQQFNKQANPSQNASDSAEDQQQGGVSLKSLILQKIQERAQNEMTETDLEEYIHPQIVHSYKQIGKILKRYKSGKLPKAFTVMPSLSMWEEALYFTNPDMWSNAAVYQATRLFVHMPEAQVQRFFGLVLLPKVRFWMRSNKKLNYHLYEALLKACFKPGAFYKGIVIPLCEAGDCSHAESVVIGSVIKRKSLPILHSAAALLRITMIPYTATYDTILKSMIEKEYALPSRVVSGLVAYFVKFREENRHLPIIWHQTLLHFVQLYKQDITRTQKHQLLALIEKHRSSVTQDIKREILRGHSQATPFSS